MTSEPHLPRRNATPTGGSLLSTGVFEDLKN